MGISPPIDVLPSLSRLMNAGIGAGKTRTDHRALADQLYAFYAEGRDLRRLVAIIGETSLTDADRRYLDFARQFEERFVRQHGRRTIDETLDLAWSLLDPFSDADLKRINPQLLEQFRSERDRSSVDGGRPT